MNKATEPSPGESSLSGPAEAYDFRCHSSYLNSSLRVVISRTGDQVVLSATGQYGFEPDRKVCKALALADWDRLRCGAQHGARKCTPP